MPVEPTGVTAAEGRPRLPSGVVTFVMTDIEGSTRLFRELGERYPSVLATHNALLRDAFSRHGGVEVNTEGDSLLVAFANPVDAVAGALDGQLSLAEADWPEGFEVRVRMGVHTGEAIPVGHDYVSLTLHQAARISAGAHGGQVLASEATATSVSEQLASFVQFVPLGAFQLRGFPAPERLYQVQHPRLQHEFPPVRAVGVLAHNLPFFRSSFVGRAEERDGLAAILHTTGVVTIVGAGGVGKTRLAIQVAFDVLDRFEDGAWLVDLAPLGDPSSIPTAVASAMGIGEVRGRNLRDVVVEVLGSKSALLILDNCEHLLEAVAAFAELVSQRCPAMVVLSTSREPLDIEGEVTWWLDPLATVDPKTVTGVPDIATSDAVRLFIERARSVQPGFQLTDANAGQVASVVSHLNGIPLAVELAAATLGERSLDSLVAGLADRFSLLVRGRRTAPIRHRTLRAAIEWSLDLLTPVERLLFDRLSVFAGGGTMAAAAEVCSGGSVNQEQVPELLGRLVRASLLSLAPETVDRWTILESIRQLGTLELKDRGEAEEFSLRHRVWVAERVEAVTDQIGRRGKSSMSRELAQDHDNVRRGLDTAVAASDVDVALRICTAMTPFWTSHGDWTEGTERLRSALALEGGESTLRGRALADLGSLLLLRGELAQAEKSFAEARHAAKDSDDPVTFARAIAGEGYIAFRGSRLNEAEECWQEALKSARRGHDRRTEAGVLRSLAIAAGSGGRQDRATELLEEAIALADSSGDDQLLRLVLGSSAEMNLWLGRYALAERLYGEALSLADNIGDISARPLLLAELGWVALLRGDPTSAGQLAVDAAELAEDLGTPRVLSHSLRLRGEALLRTGQIYEAASTLDTALRVAEGLDAPAEVAGVRCSQANVALETEQLEEAREQATQAVELSPLAHSMRRNTPGWVLGVVSLLERDLASAEARFRHGRAEADAIGAPRHRSNSLWGLAGVDAARGETRRAAQLHLDALFLRHELEDRLGFVDSLVGIAAAVARAAPQEAAMLLDAATSLRAKAGARATPFEVSQIAAATAALGDDAESTSHPREDGSTLDEERTLELAERLVTVID